MSAAGTYVYEILNSTGTVCCGGNKPDFPRCPRCQDKHVNGHRSLGAAVPKHNYAPPDPYAQQLAPMRAEMESHKPVIPAPVSPLDDPKYTGQPNSAPPNGFQIALDRLKKRGHLR